MIAEDWLAGASEHAGSWWDHWSKWYAQHGAGEVPAPKNPRQRAASRGRSRTRPLRSPEMSKPHVEFVEVDGVNLRVATQTR